MSTPYEFVAVQLLRHNDITILYAYLIYLRLDFISTNSGLWWPITAIRQKHINLLILDRTLIILYWK